MTNNKINLDAHEPAFQGSLERSLKHPPPYFEEELFFMTNFHSTYMTDFSVFPKYFGCLRMLSLHGCHIHDFDHLQGLNDLWYFNASKTYLRTLEPLRDKKLMSDIYLNTTLVEDLSPLLDFPRLSLIKVHATPLSDESYHEILPLLETTIPAERVKPPGPDPFTLIPLVYKDKEEDWKLTRALWERGIEAGFRRTGSDDDPYFCVLASGQSYVPKPQHEIFSITPEILWGLIHNEPNLTFEMIVEASQNFVNAKYS